MADLTAPGAHGGHHGGAAHHGTEEMRACIQVCTECYAACLEMARHCLDLAYRGKHGEAGHVTMLLDCAEICQTSANFMLRGSPNHAHTCGACAEICRACERECRRFGDDAAMQWCAEVCQRCAESCARMAAMAA